MLIYTETDGSFAAIALMSHLFLQCIFNGWLRGYAQLFRSSYQAYMG